MVDTTKLMYLDTFITEATTDVIVESFLTKKKIGRIATKNKAIIEPGQVMSIDGTTHIERYKIKLQTDSHANMMAVKSDIIDGCEAYLHRDVGFTYPEIMHHVYFAYTNKGYVKNGIWKHDIFIDVEWGK